VKSPNTIDNYRWAVNRHLKPALGSKRLRTLKPEHFEALLRRLAHDGMARTSLARIRSVAVIALRYAQRRDLVARNAAELAYIPADARPQREGRSLTLEEARRLLAATEDDDAGPLVVVGLMLGLRPGELSGLRWNDIDLTAKTLTVRQARLRERGPDGREVLRLGEPKTRRSRRTVSLPRPVIAALGRQRANQARHRLAAAAEWQDLDLVFTTNVGTPLDPSNLRRSIERITERARLGHWTPHELGRHSAASLLSAAGVPIEVVADLLGHVDTRMLEKHYRHRVTPSVDAAVTPMEDMFGPS
jgi:integrase